MEGALQGLQGVVPKLIDALQLRKKDAAAVSTVIAKPQMRGLLKHYMRRNLLIGAILSVSSGYAYKHFVADVRRERYAEFYRTFDAEKEFEVMKRKGLFQSC